MVHNQPGFSAVIRSLRAWLISDKEPRCIAITPVIAGMSQPVNGNNTPAANTRNVTDGAVDGIDRKDRIDGKIQ